MVFKFTIDRALNRHIPTNQTHYFPKYVKRFFGNHNPGPYADYWIWSEILISTFCGIALLEGLFKSDTVFKSHHAPMIIASYGATAILCFNANASPLAQPRNILMGQVISTIVGICIAKLFGLSSAGREHFWASGALSVAVSSVLMSIFNCVHPPAGASALLPSIDAQIMEMSWWYLPAQIVSSVLVICVAMITGNLFRKYPLYWWLAGPHPKHEAQKELEKNKATKEDLESQENEGIKYAPHSRTIAINANEIIIPTELDLTTLEIEWLELIQEKLIEMPTRDTDKDLNT